MSKRAFQLFYQINNIVEVEGGGVRLLIYLENEKNINNHWLVRTVILSSGGFARVILGAFIPLQYCGSDD